MKIFINMSNYVYLAVNKEKKIIFQYFDTIIEVAGEKKLLIAYFRLIFTAAIF